MFLLKNKITYHEIYLFMNIHIKKVLIRTILNSESGRSIEAELHTPAGLVGVGATPAAIAPGRREKDTTPTRSLGLWSDADDVNAVLDHLCSTAFDSQRTFDAYLSRVCVGIGSDISLALSLAFARVCAAASGITLVDHLSAQAGTRPAMPHPLINVFSGGIHARDALGVPCSQPSHLLPMQQLMIVPHCPRIHDDIECALATFHALERAVKETGLLRGYSPSSGMLVPTMALRALLDLIQLTFIRLGFDSSASLGADVAAEHLKLDNGRYRFGDRRLEPDGLRALHTRLLYDYEFCFYEDPFDAEDVHEWRALTHEMSGRTAIVGDDLFATNAEYIVDGLASGILLKMNQIGTVTGTLDAANAARAHGMRVCVSHRSKETEDTAMCDLAVALGADYIKIGGPRRGDRIDKYNRLLRLAERYG